MHSHHLAEDIAQQVFIELSTAIKRYDPRRSFPPGFTESPSTGVWTSYRRLKRREDRYVPIVDGENLPSPDPSPEDESEKSELSDTIRKAIWALDPKHRAVLVLRYYHGFSEAEIAVALGCPPGTVKSRLNTARGRLREILDTRASPLTVPRQSKPPLPHYGVDGYHRNGVGQESGPAGKALTNQELFTSNSHLEEKQRIAYAPGRKSFE